MFGVAGDGKERRAVYSSGGLTEPGAGKFIFRIGFFFLLKRRGIFRSGFFCFAQRQPAHGHMQVTALAGRVATDPATRAHSLPWSPWLMSLASALPCSPWLMSLAGDDSEQPTRARAGPRLDH